MQLRALFAVFFVLALLASSGCPTPEPPTRNPNLAFKNVTVNKSRANIGDQIRVDWDYENRDKLKSHMFRSMSLLLQGIKTEDQQVSLSLPWAITFTFQGPVTIELSAMDTSTPSRGISVAFDIKLTEDFSFTAEVESTHRNYPRLGYPSGRASRKINFTTFLGVYEKVEIVPPSQIIEDGLIDELALNPVVAAFLPTAEAFRARSWDVREATKFSMKGGAAFPFLDPGFLASSDGIQFAGIPRADGIIFAGGIAYEGTVTTVKTAEGDLEVRSGAPSFEPIFMAIDVRTTRDGRPFLADIHVGNLPQGLVVSVFHGSTLNRTPGQWTLQYEVGANGIGWISGQIKASRLGFGVTTTNGTILVTTLGGIEFPGVYVTLTDVTFKVPFYPDTNPGGRVRLD